MIFVRSMAGLAGAALATCTLTFGTLARAQVLFVDSATLPNDLIGFDLASPTPSLSPIPALQSPLNGAPLLSRWAVGDLDRDNKYEVVFTFPILANTGRLFVFTYDPVARNYLDRGSIQFIANTDGQLFTGDIDDDGRDEVMLAESAPLTPPQPRPSNGGTTTINIIDVQNLNPLTHNVFRLPNQFVTRHSHFAARDITGDRRAEFFMLTQETKAASQFNEPLGSASLYICSPVLTSPVTCNALGPGSIPASPEGRFPTDIDAADIDNDGVVEFIVGYGTSCQVNDSRTVRIYNLGGFALERQVSLARPFQHITARDVDGDGTTELIATSGVPGQSGGLQVYGWNSGTNQFDLRAETTYAVPVNACQPVPTDPTDPQRTQQPAAVIGVGAPRDLQNDGCDGIDNDNDGTKDENCLLRFLFVPMCYNGTDEQFRADTQADVDFLLRSLEMDGCRENVFVDWIPQSAFEIAADCNPDYRIGDYPRDIKQGLNQLGIDHSEWTSVNAYTNDLTFPANDPQAGDGLVYGSNDGETWVRKRGPVLIGTISGNPFNIVPETTLAHEFGHLLSLGEEYSPGAALNPLEGRLGCDPAQASCCDYFDPENPTVCSFFKGNRTRFGDGRCIMSSVNADQPAFVPAIRRDWCENCFTHIKQFNPIRKQLTTGLSCGAAYNGYGPMVDFTATVSSSGGMSQITARFVPFGRPAMATPDTGDLHFRIEDASGVAFYEARFPSIGSTTFPVETGQSFYDPVYMGLRVPVPAGVTASSRLPMVVSKNGVEASRTTFNGAPPVANAGPDQTIECNQLGGGTFALDGTASSDPDGDSLQYSWSSTTASIIDPENSTPIGVAPLGTSTVSLTVSDGLLQSSADSVNVTVVDTVPPTLSGPPEVTVRACQVGLTQIQLPLPQVSDVCTPVTVNATITHSNGVPLNPPVTFDNGLIPAGALTTGMHTIRWQATDQTNHTTTFVQTIRIEPCWPMFGRTNERRRASPINGPQTNARLWVFSQNPLDIRSSPAVARDGTIYFGSNDNKVYAVRPDGTLKWTRQTGGDVDSSPAIGFDDTVYVASDDDRLYALRPGDGSVICSRDLGDRDGESSPAVGADGTVYVGSEDNRLHAINGKTCALRWTYLTGGDVRSSPAVGPDGVVYVGSGDRKVHAVRASGAVKWTFSTGGDVDSTPALSVDGAFIYVGSDDDRLYALRTADGTAFWSRNLDWDVEASPAIGPDGTVYVASQSGRMHAVDPSDGSVRWSRDLGIGVTSSAAIGADGIVYVGSDDDRVYALNGATGAIIWSFKTGADVHSSPAIGANGVLFVGSDDDKLYAFGSP